MKRHLFTVLRALSVLVGLLFVIAPLIAKEDELLSLLLMATLGLVFVAYGLTGSPTLPKTPLRLHLLSEASLALFYLVSGLFFLARPERPVLNRLAGAVLLSMVVASMWAAYAKRRSPPAV